jgi:hypothetical protein
MIELETDLKHRTLDLLRASADSDGRGHVTNRALGERLGCSISNFPRLWKQLVAKQILVIERSDRMGTIYRLLEQGEPPPRPMPEPLILPQRPMKGIKPAVSPRRAVALKAATTNLVDELERLEQMHQRGALDDDEFRAFKQALRAQYQR